MISTKLSCDDYAIMHACPTPLGGDRRVTGGDRRAPYWRRRKCPSRPPYNANAQRANVTGPMKLQNKTTNVHVNATAYPVRRTKFTATAIINPRRACARVTVLVLSVCLSVCVFSLFWHLAQSGVQTAVSATSARYGHEI